MVSRRRAPESCQIDLGCFLTLHLYGFSDKFSSFGSSQISHRKQMLCLHPRPPQKVSIQYTTAVNLIYNEPEPSRQLEGKSDRDMSEDKPLLLLFDGNALIHRAFHALPPLTVSKTGEMVNAVQGFASTLLKVLMKSSPPTGQSPLTDQHLPSDTKNLRNTKPIVLRLLKSWSAR